MKTDQTRNEGSRVLSFNNLAHIEIRWVCSRHDPVDGAGGEEREWKTCKIEDLRCILSFLEIQLLAYPRAKTITIDFIGWDHIVRQSSPVLRPVRSFVKGERPARFLGGLSEIVIRGLEREQRNCVVELVGWALRPN